MAANSYDGNISHEDMMRSLGITGGELDAVDVKISGLFCLRAIASLQFTSSGRFPNCRCVFFCAFFTAEHILLQKQKDLPSYFALNL